jgi:general secretion pathway protein J
MRKKTITKSSSGFTLLELLISVTLIAVLVLILSMAVRTGLRAYSRGKEINERLIVVSAIEGLLGRQLRAVVREDRSDLKNFSEFNGEKNEISFVTTHVPLGSQAGGLFKVVYRFDERGKKLIYAQKVITRN